MRTNIIRHETMMVSYDVANGWTVVEVDGGKSNWGDTYMVPREET